MGRIQMLSYNTSMNLFFGEEKNLITLPRQQQWSGARIHQLLEDVQKQTEVAAQVNIHPEVKTHYRALLTDLIKTYGH